jgi:hypothetical protein
MSTLAISAIGAKPGTMVEVAPGKTYVAVPPESIDTVAVVELVPAGDGTFRPVARICPRRFAANKKNLRRFGIAISERSMGRLVLAGLVKGERVTPGVLQVDYFDYLRHEQAASDPEFWDRVEPGQVFSNRERFQQAL